MPQKALYNYLTGEFIREATEKECKNSFEASKTDGGAGCILVGGVICFVTCDLS